MNFMRFPGNRTRALTLSYDDGVQQDRRMMEILDKHGIKCTFNLNGSAFEEDERNYAEGQIHRRMAKREALEVYNGELGKPHEIAVHGYTHPFLERLPSEMVSYEIIEDRKMLESIFGRVIKGCAYPYGTFSDDVVDTLHRCGILYARTTVPTRRFDIPTDWLRMPATCHHNDPELMNLCDKFLANDAPRQFPQLFYLWGHTYEFEANDNWDVIERFAEKMGGHDDIWYATNMEVYLYVEAYRALHFSADGNSVFNPSSQTVCFNSNGVDVTVAPGETVKIR